MNTPATPPWQVPGARVALLRRRGPNEHSVTLTTIEKVTATQLVLADGSRFRRGPNPVQDATSTGASATHLVPADDPRVARALWRQEADRLETVVVAAHDALLRDPTVAGARALADAATAYAEHLQDAPQA